MNATEFIEPTQPVTDPKRRYLCRHVFTEGHRCGSPALRGQSLCYYHGRSRREAGISGNTHCFSMPRIDDRATIQLAIYEVLSRVAGGDIEYKRGSTLLYGLQIASANLPRPQLKAEQPPQVEEVTTDCHLGDLAPIAEILDPAEAPCVGAGAPGSTASSSTLGIHPAAAATDPQPCEREYTEEERHFLDTNTSIMGRYLPGNCPRPKSLTDEDITARIDALRRRAGLRPIGTEQDRSRSTRLATPAQETSSPAQTSQTDLTLAAVQAVACPRRSTRNRTLKRAIPPPQGKQQDCSQQRHEGHHQKNRSVRHMVDQHPGQQGEEQSAQSPGHTGQARRSPNLVVGKQISDRSIHVGREKIVRCGGDADQRQCHRYPGRIGNEKAREAEQAATVHQELSHPGDRHAQPQQNAGRPASCDSACAAHKERNPC